MKKIPSVNHFIEWVSQQHPNRKISSHVNWASCAVGDYARENFGEEIEGQGFNSTVLKHLCESEGKKYDDSQDDIGLSVMGFLCGEIYEDDEGNEMDVRLYVDYGSLLRAIKDFKEIHNLI